MRINITKRARRGFTLMEIMVVVVVLGILAAVVTANVMGRDDEARLGAAKTDIGAFSMAIDMFKLHMGRYPDESEQFEVLRTPPADDQNGKWKGPYLTRPVPNDPWGNPYNYYNPSPDGISRYGVESYGSDGQPGGIILDFSKDINSWSNYEDDNIG